MKENRILKIFIAVLAIYAIVGFFLLPTVLKPQLIKIINENITKTATIQNIAFNPFTFMFKIKGFKILDGDQEMVSFKEFYLDFSLLKSLHKRHISFKEINLIDAKINLIEDKNGVINLSTLTKSTPTKQENKKNTEKSSINFKILKTSLKNATITYTKNSDIDPFSVAFNRINYTFYDLGSYKHSLASHSLKTFINKNTKLEIDGGFRLEPFNMYANVSLKNLKPTEFLDYKKSMLNFKMKENASIDLSFGYQLNMKKQLELKVQNLYLYIKNIELAQNKKKILAFKNLALENMKLNYPAQNISIKNLVFDSLSANITNPKEGKLNLLSLIKEDKKEISKDTKKVQTKETKPWNITLNDFNLSKSYLNFDDYKTNNFIKTSNVNLSIKDILFKENNLSIKRVKVEKPNILYKNSTQKNQLDLKELDIQIKDIEKQNNKISVETFQIKQPTLTYQDKRNKLLVKTEDLKIILKKFLKKDNDIFLKNLTIKEPKIAIRDKKTLKDIDIKGVYLNFDKLLYSNSIASIEKINFKKNSLKFEDKIAKTKIDSKNIDLNINKLIYQENTLAIKNSILNKPYISVILPKKESTRKKTSNKKQTKKSINKKTSKDEFKMQIGPFKIKNAKLKFEDKNLPIPFKTLVSSLNGDFSEFNSTSSKPTKLKLEGKVDKYGYTKITGFVEHKDIKELTDVNLLFKNIAIKNFTPYSGKFIGREIESGKLNLNLKYNIKKSNLDAKNSILISDIKLGKNIQSPDAVSLPLELAIALLEDSNGVIDLELPISGNVNDPQFSIAPIVWKVFTNLIVKAITSPFTLLASLLGVEEDEIKSIEFEYAQSSILASEKEALDNIAKILEKRPKLGIKIDPTYDIKKDTNAIKELKTDKLIEKTIQSIKIKKGDKYKITLEKIYKSYAKLIPIEELKKTFTKVDKNKKSVFDNESYIKELKNIIKEKQTVTKEELITLTQKRVAAIKNYLITTKKVPSKKISINKIKELSNSKNFTKFDLEVDVSK